MLQPRGLGCPRRQCRRAPPRLLRLSHEMGTLRNELLRRPSFRNHYDGVVLDWQYLEARSEETLLREARWWAWQKLRVVVDFTSGNTVFPGPLRMMDDYWYNGTGVYGTGPYYTRSMMRLQAVLRKMPLVGAHDALLTLHGPGGLGLPASFPTPDFIDLFRQTFIRLEAVATPLNVTLHLRQTGRNGILRRTTNGSPPLNLSAQVKFVRSVCPGTGPSCVKVAPQFAHNASVADVRALVADGTATLLLLSAEANDLNPNCQFSDNMYKNGAGCKMQKGPYPGGECDHHSIATRCFPSHPPLLTRLGWLSHAGPNGGNSFTGPTEGAPLVTLGAAGRTRLAQWAAIRSGLGGVCSLVLDAAPALDGEGGRAAELADVAML